MSWRSSRYPFTASQWQELEHQSLIFKYLASGIPIPSDLILPLRRSFLLDSTPSTTPSLAFPPQPSLGWGWQQLGYGGRGKAEDPEPGRCRRTDGKKWRCSKEAYPDSKYCEKHMHRGKNRSRKPVEMSLSSITTSSKSSTHYAPPSLSISTTMETPSHHLFYSRPPGIAFHPPNSCPLDKDHHRYRHGMKDVDECSFLSEASSGSERENCLQFRPLGERKHSPAEVGLVKEQQHCFVLGADFKLEKPVEEEREETQRPLRHFFEEWPKKSKGSLLGLEEEEEHSSSKTQLWLSISKWFSSLISHPRDLTSFLALISLSFFFFLL